MPRDWTAVAAVQDECGRAAPAWLLYPDDAAAIAAPAVRRVLEETVAACCAPWPEAQRWRVARLAAVAAARTGGAAAARAAGLTAHASVRALSYRVAASPPGRLEAAARAALGPCFQARVHGDARLVLEREGRPS